MVLLNEFVQKCANFSTLTACNHLKWVECFVAIRVGEFNSHSYVQMYQQWELFFNSNTENKEFLIRNPYQGLRRRVFVEDRLHVSQHTFGTIQNVEPLERCWNHHIINSNNFTIELHFPTLNYGVCTIDFVNYFNECTFFSRLD